MEPSIPQTESYKYCDLVMKGGITSGVIYPAAAVKLSAESRYKNIGGTSAGAIRCRRYRGRPIGPAPPTIPIPSRSSRLFPMILPATDTFLKLFTPDPSTRKVFRVALGDWFKTGHSSAK